MIDYTADSGLAFPKSRPKGLEKEDRDTARDARDKKESAKARTRAKGRCEVHFQSVADPGGVRCISKDTQTHHLQGGIGRKNRGDSILAIQKLRVCTTCHDLITKHILQPTTADATALTIRYRRVR